MREAPFVGWLDHLSRPAMTLQVWPRPWSEELLTRLGRGFVSGFLSVCFLVAGFAVNWSLGF